MQLTVTIDEDVAAKLRPLLKGGDTGSVINGLLRKALEPHRRNVELPVFHLGLQPHIDPTSLNKLAEELALEEDIERLRRAEQK